LESGFLGAGKVALKAEVLSFEPAACSVVFQKEGTPVFSTELNNNYVKYISRVLSL